MVKRLLVLGLMVIGLAALPRPAQARVSCTQDMEGCFASASQLYYWWDRSAAGLDCELGFAGCVRQALIG